MTVSPDAKPDDGTIRAQLLLAARGGCRGALHDALPAYGVRIASGSDAGVGVRVLLQIDDDPFPQVNPLCRPMDGVLELEGPRKLLSREVAATALGAILDDLDPVVHRDLSGAVFGTVQRVIPGPVGTAPMRYIYLMRRRADVSRAEYFDHYFNRHSAFAFHLLRGIHAYTQVHVDDVESSALARDLRVGVHSVESVTELYIESIQSMMDGTDPEAYGATDDEMRFVDRDNSVAFTGVQTSIREPE